MEISKTIYYYFRLKVFQVEKKLRWRKPNQTDRTADHTAMECSLCKFCVYVLIFITLFFALSYQISVVAEIDTPTNNHINVYKKFYFYTLIQFLRAKLMY